MNTTTNEEILDYLYDCLAGGIGILEAYYCVSRQYDIEEDDVYDLHAEATERYAQTF